MNGRANIARFPLCRAVFVNGKKGARKKGRRRGWKQRSVAAKKRRNGGRTCVINGRFRFSLSRVSFCSRVSQNGRRVAGSDQRSHGINLLSSPAVLLLFSPKRSNNCTGFRRIFLRNHHTIILILLILAELVQISSPLIALFFFFIKFRQLFSFFREKEIGNWATLRFRTCSIRSDSVLFLPHKGYDESAIGKCSTWKWKRIIWEIIGNRKGGSELVGCLE